MSIEREESVTISSGRDAMPSNSKPAAKPFTSRNTETAVEHVVSQVKEALIAGNLEPGARLPTEHELSAQLQVSRGSVREAMKVLQSLGIVRVVRGSGTFVSESPAESLFEPLVFRFILSEPGKQHLVELRETIELGIGQLILRNADEQAIESLEEANRALADAVDCDAPPDTIADCDLRFHGALSAATGNPLVENVYAVVLDFFKPLIRETYNRSGNGRNAVALHAQLIEAFRSRDAEACRSATVAASKQWAQRF